jgi:CRP-like cAMP-binding protein
VTTENYLDLLRHQLEQSGITDAPPQELQKLLEILSPKTFLEGEHLLEALSKKSFFGFIQSGFVRFYYSTHEGKEFNQTFKFEQDFIMSYYTLMSGKPSPFAIQAMEPTTVLMGDYEDLKTLWENSHFWAKVAIHFLQHNFMIKVEREANLLQLDALDRYKKFLLQFKNHLNRIPKQHVAMYLGITPVSLSRLIKN